MTTACNPAFAAALRARVRGEVREAEPLSRWSTYRIGGAATVLFPGSAADVAEALRQCAANGVPWFALGLGSNILFPDAGLDALVIRIGKGLDLMEHHGGGRWAIGAGLPQALAAKRSAAAGWSGIHKMVGVPGSVGGGVVMNAGCHGAEWRDVVRHVLVVDELGNDGIVAAADAGFDYRRSALGRVVVLAATVDLVAEDPARLEAETDALYKWRREETPFNQPCCGSVFKNPVQGILTGAAELRTSGQFIEAAGLKGWRVGGIEVSPMHANYFVNTGGGTAADVLALIKEVRQRVRDRFGVTLEPEVKVIQRSGSIGSVGG
jgi:UDP-N-acetylmuramate dehydrogenase